jgi:tRNA A-37 threonylcarbamoyl transferase component Bud32
MAHIQINPRYRQDLQWQGLTSAEDFANLPSVIISGHPDRNVARVRLRGCPLANVLIKREHRILWKDRLQNAAAGFGFVSKSHREAVTLRRLALAKVSCPEWIAHGVDDRGGAFLLVGEISDAKELRWHLRDLQGADRCARRRFLQQLGEQIAALHNAGFDQPDLYSKHILVRPSDESIWFIDWQRSRPTAAISWRRRWRDLAVLAATVAEPLARFKDRLAFLGAYLRECRKKGLRTPTQFRCAFEIFTREAQLLRKPRIREMRKMPFETDRQSLVWRRGEALCLTPAFERDLKGSLPDWLLLDNLPTAPSNLHLRDCVFVPGHGPCDLTRRRIWRLRALIWTRLLGRRFISQELQTAGLSFRLERAGIPAPRLLSFGQRMTAWGLTESFVLVEPPDAASGIVDWLACEAGYSARLRHSVLRQFGALIKRLHETNCVLSSGRRVTDNSLELLGHSFCVETSGGVARVALASIERLSSRRRLTSRLFLADLIRATDALRPARFSRTDKLRIVLAYFGITSLRYGNKRKLQKLLVRDSPTESGAVFRQKAAIRSVSFLHTRTA